MSMKGRRRIYLMRHGHVDYFAPDLTDPRHVPLTTQGREQAQAAGEALGRIDFDLVAHSGLPRTRETAEIVMADRDDSPRMMAIYALEELKSGWITADSREELAARLAYSFDGAAEPGARFLPDGESFEDAQRRIINGLHSLIFNHDWRTALVVAHEGVNRIALGWACGGGLKTVASFEQDLGCINLIDLDITPAPAGDGLHIERRIIKAVNVTPYDFVKHGLSRTSLEHLFDVDFGEGRPKLES